MVEMKTFNKKTFNNIGEMTPYYNERTNTYEFYDNVGFLNIEIKFNLNTSSHIVARNITGNDINAWDITAGDIKANDINAWDIKADNIKANDITFYAIACAYHSIKCKSIVGRRPNARYFCLDSEVKMG